MKWTEITVFTTEEGLDSVCARFDMLGIDGVVIEQSRDAIEKFLNETAKYWDYADMDELVTSDTPCVKAYIPCDEDAHRKIDEIESSFEQLSHTDTGVELGSLKVVFRIADDSDWLNKWRLYYKPMNIGERLLVVPSWEQTSETEGRTVLKLDPGMAFGTGSHQTTRMCLEYLERVVKHDDALADLGCGSGILAIAGILLGAKHATGVDIDPITEHVAAENAGLNGIDGAKFELKIGDILTDDNLRTEVGGRKYDVVCANIVASVIVELCTVVPHLLVPGGYFITSGIITERFEEVRKAVEDNGLTIVNCARLDDWNAILAKLPE